MSFDLAHGLAVADRLADELFYIWLAGLLHDALEDRAIETTDLYLLESVPTETVRLVEAVTRRPEETYVEYIDRVAQDPIARTVKTADLLVNLARMDDGHESLRPRYEQALIRLGAA